VRRPGNTGIGIRHEAFDIRRQYVLSTTSFCHQYLDETIRMIGFRRHAFLRLSLLLFVLFTHSVSIFGDEEEEEEEEQNNDFLYDSEDALPVIEYQAKDNGEQQSRPDFLYESNNGPRLVVRTS
jgi:hypothetical protein